MPRIGKDSFYRVTGDPQDVKRTFNELEISDGKAPAGKWLIDPRLPRLFKYQFNVKQDEWVVIPKGIIVAFATNADFNSSGVSGTISTNTNNAGEGYYFKEYESGKYYHALTIANGGVDVPNEVDQRKADKGITPATYTRTANVPVGVMAKNSYFKRDDLMYGSVAPFITRSLIEVPYIPDRALAASVKWGCATGGDGQSGDPGYLRPGDFVKSDANGHFVKWNPGTTASIALITNATVSAGSFSTTMSDGAVGTGVVRIGGDDPRQIVGQVMDVTGQLQPEGWLQWTMWNLDMVDADISKVLGIPAEYLDLKTGYPWLDKYNEIWKYARDHGLGIEGLTDGSNIVTTVTDEPVGYIRSGMKAGDKLFFHLKRANIDASTLKLYKKDVPAIKVGVGETYNDGTTNVFKFYAYDNSEGQHLIIIELLADYTNATPFEIVASFDATGMVPGVPTTWDLKGSVGAVRILLGGLR